MGFDVTPEVYFRFMGRFSEPLAARFASALEIPAGARLGEPSHEAEVHLRGDVETHPPTVAP